MSITPPLEVFCDEAGSTGPALLDEAQRYFAYSSVALAAPEAEELVKELRNRFPVQMPELKAAKLLKTSRGQLLIRELLERVSGRYALVVHDKVLALCAQFYEYIFEPVFKESPWFLYERKLHHFVAMVLYSWFRGRERDAQDALAQFQAYMRSLDDRQAPLLFGRIDMSERLDADPLQYIIRFARATRQEILSDNETLVEDLPAEGRWILDLATTSMWSHLNHWGVMNRPLAVTCDESKPLRANIPEFTGDENDPGIRRARMKSHAGHLGWRWSRPVEFANSMDHAGLQLADVISGVATYAIRADVPPEDNVEFFRTMLQQHTLKACILPDFRLIDPRNKSAAVHAAMLYRFAVKAERGDNLRMGVQEDYQLVEAAWDAGSFRMG